MITPGYIEKGNKIGLVAPARSITFEEVHPTIKLFQKWGWEVVLGTSVFNKYNQFAGTDDQRRRDMQQMLDDPSVKGIICARGGYGTIRILDRLDFTDFSRNPKWIIGYSDITVLHCHIQQNFGIETLHAIMPLNILSDETVSDSLETLHSALSGSKLKYILPRSTLSRQGTGEGTLVGGNLSILYSLMGSSSVPDMSGKILFLEEVDEYLYHIDRMMMTLKRAGKLKNLKGLIVGGMERMNDNKVPFGKTANQIIAEAVAEYRYPVCFDFPAGHGSNNLALILGRNVRLTVENEVTISF
jgi:muramoyltetrapeptide carboxypeptidase